MSCGFIPGSSNRVLQFSTARGGGGGDAGGWTGPSHLHVAQRAAGLPAGLSSSSWRTRAAVEGGGFVGEGSFYELLGVPEGGGADEIKRAYKRMAKRYHPDASPPDRADENTRRFIEVQQAYETLSDPRRRSLYDRDLALGLHVAFSTRKRFNEELEEKSEWRNHWQDQIIELKRRSANKDSEEKLSWGARLRRQMSGPSRE